MVNTMAKIGPFAEDHLFYRVNVPTGNVTCNHLTIGCTWYVQTQPTINQIFQVDLGTSTGFASWEEEVISAYGSGPDAEALFMENFPRGVYGTGTNEDMRCEECKAR